VLFRAPPAMCHSEPAGEESRPRRIKAIHDEIPPSSE
jgi:hypothetical protein